MRTTRYLFALWLAAVSMSLMGCVYASSQMALADDLKVTATDNPEQRRFDVQLQWLGPRKACLDDETWPTALGQIPNPYGVRLFVDGSEQRARGTNGGYCPRGCFSELRPGQTRDATLKYEVFGDPEMIRSAQSRELRFEPRVIACPPVN